MCIVSGRTHTHAHTGDRLTVDELRSESAVYTVHTVVVVVVRIKNSGLYGCITLRYKHTVCTLWRLSPNCLFRIRSNKSARAQVYADFIAYCTACHYHRVTGGAIVMVVV